MNILMICGVISDENHAEVIEHTKGYAEFSANIFQKKLIKGFIQNHVELDVISAPLIGSYPNRYKKMFFRGFEQEQSQFEYVHFCNIWGYRNFSRAAALKKKIRELAQNGKKYEMILVYSAHEPYLEAAVFGKQLFHNAKICYVVPDLPQYMNLDAHRTKIYDYLKKIDIKRMDSLNQKVDSFVILTEPMKELLHIGNRPYIVVEGIVDDLSVTKGENVQESDETKNIVYTGKLNYQFGIKELVDTFVGVKGEQYRLVLCGDGDAREYICEQAKKDPRIIYKGQVSPTEAKKVMDSASVLVNPRPNQGEYIKYSFPSKNIEYLMSGKPVVAYMLDGMSQEYSKFIYPIQNVENIGDSLTNALHEDNRKKYLDFYEYAEEHLLGKSIANRILAL